MESYKVYISEYKITVLDELKMSFLWAQETLVKLEAANVRWMYIVMGG